MMNNPPEDWCDKDAWDRYFDAELLAGRVPSFPDFVVYRFLSLVRTKGGRVWFPGCGLDPYPYTYAKRGCTVVATDFSSVAVGYQQWLAATFAKDGESTKVKGSLTVAEHDFSRQSPPGRFDVLISSRAFHGLSDSAMDAAARHFHMALRPGGVCIIDTLNVQGRARDRIEDSLTAAGFYIPFHESERWYRRQLDGTGIVHEMILDRPHIPAADQYPPEHFVELASRDQQILDSFRVEYERRREDEAVAVNTIVSNPATIVAHVVYATG